MFRTSKGRHRWAGSAQRNPYAVVLSPLTRRWVRVWAADLDRSWWAIDYV